MSTSRYFDVLYGPANNVRLLDRVMCLEDELREAREANLRLQSDLRESRILARLRLEATLVALGADDLACDPLLGG